jgi:hypothetical protein
MMCFPVLQPQLMCCAHHTGQFDHGQGTAAALLLTLLLSSTAPLSGLPA